MFSFYWQSNRKTLRNSGHIEQHIRLRKTTVCRNRILFRPTELQKQKDSETTVLAVGDERLNHIRNILKLLPGDKFKVNKYCFSHLISSSLFRSGNATVHVYEMRTWNNRNRLACYMGLAPQRLLETLFLLVKQRYIFRTMRRKHHFLGHLLKSS